MAKPKFKFGCPKTVIAVVRVSDAKQELSHEAQAQKIEQYCQSHGLTLTAVFIETVTSVAPLEERHGLQAAMAALRPLNAGILLFLNRTRISRDVVLSKMIERAALREGAVVTSTEGLNGDTPHEEMLRTIMDAVAQHERAELIKRTKAALQVKKARGEHLGNVPYGYQWRNGQTVPHPEEQEVIARVRALAQAGMSAPKISQALGPVNRRGNTFGKTQILKMLRQV